MQSNTPAAPGPEPACPEEFAWMKPGEKATELDPGGILHHYTISGLPTHHGDWWMVAVNRRDGKSDDLMDRAAFCENLSPGWIEPLTEAELFECIDGYKPAPPSEADTLRTQLEAAQQKIQRLDALLVKAAGYIDLTPDTPGYETRLNLMEEIRNEWHSK